MITQIYFLGGQSRLDRIKYPHLYVRTLMVSKRLGWYGFVSNFKNGQECVLYRDELEAIKSQLQPLRGERMELLQALYPPH